MSHPIGEDERRNQNPAGTMTFEQFFTTATGGNQPYDYQRRLAEDSACQSLLIEIPTGLGKTAAVVLAWLWNRVHLGKKDWPRRLVYCLPMRTLVEQTAGEAKKWLGDRVWDGKSDHQGKVGLHILMGGEDSGEWDIHPEREAILIGTQDMLLSRALNRGYGMSRYRWPMHFGLLNNDALWVFDEVQLMGAGLPTTAQIEAFRKQQAGTGCFSWWMSATSDRSWLKTVDFDPASLGDAVRLPDEDLVPDGKVDRLLNASKPLHRAVVGGADLKALAKEIVAQSEKTDGLTLAVVNTVKTARKLFTEVEKLTRKVATKPLLLHSRFRPMDRADILREVLAAEGQRRLVISTQVIEAGVDLSAATLFTELAPWSSLVQRFGRCNRRGTEPDAKIFWFEPASVAPYTEEQLAEARQRLNDASLTSASPNALRAVPIPAADRPAAAHVIRRKDLIELFDTTPDLAGNDLDIDRWVREADESTVQLFWREWEGGGKGRRPGDEQKQPSREELCPASIGEFRDFVKKTSSPVWRWDFLEGEWQSVRESEVYPGQNYLLPIEAGGYVAATGWSPDSKTTVTPIVVASDEAEDKETDGEPLSQSGQWQSIAQHTNQVCTELESILSALAIDKTAALRLAARWHDWGKAHPAFQAKLKPDAAAERERHLGSEPMAKAPKVMWRYPKLPAKPKHGEVRRKFLRHELASALGVLHPEAVIPVEGAERDLVAYLIAAHHGKVRLSIRSLPGEWPAPDPGRFARGVWDGDILPKTSLGGTEGSVTTASAITLSLEPMELGLGQQSPFVGLPSWSDRMLTLRDGIGIFRLAYLETLLRAADERASALAGQPVSAETSPHEPSRTNPPVAGAARRGAASPPDAGHPTERLLEHVDGGRAGESRVAEGNMRAHDQPKRKTGSR